MAAQGRDSEKVSRQNAPPDPHRGRQVAGALVAGRYRLDRLVGQGGMGVVWAATHTVTARTVALKFLKAPVLTTEVRRRFLREARVANAIRHPHIVEVHDIFDLDDGSPVMVMELLSRVSLAGRLQRELRLPLAEVASILLPVIAAVGAAHAMGVVHRDLKPENIFLPEGSSGQIKVLDFGIAKLTALDGHAAQTTAITESGAMLGTPCYMAPEQAFGEREIDHRADIWALGLILYECLAGVLPTHAENMGQVFKIILTNAIPPLEAIAPDLPPELTHLVGRMLSRAREARPADLREVASVLASCAGVPSPTFGPPSVPRAHAPAPSPPLDGPRMIRGGATIDPLASTATALAAQDAGAGTQTLGAPSRHAGSTRVSAWKLAAIAGAAGLVVGGAAVRTLRSEPSAKQPASSFPLIIESIPSGAEVHRAGRYLGVTPIRFSIRNADVEASPIWLSIQKQGYEPYTVEQGPSDEPQHVVATLTPESSGPGGPAP